MGEVTYGGIRIRISSGYRGDNGDLSFGFRFRVYLNKIPRGRDFEGNSPLMCTIPDHRVILTIFRHSEDC